MLSVKDQSSVANNLKDYYKNITHSAQQLALGSKQCDEKNNIKNKLSSSENKLTSKLSYSDIVMQEAQPDFQGKNNIPSKYEIMHNSNFGKPSLDHSFKSEACIEHVLVFIFNSGFLPKIDKRCLLDSHPLIEHLHKMLNWSKEVHFIDIKDPISNYADQKCIDNQRIKKLLAATLHYRLDIPTLIRFLGGNYTGEYRNSKDTIRALKDSNCDEKVISDLQRLLDKGCPNKMNASSTHANFMDFFRYGNHSSIDKDVEKTKKAMNKEDRNQYLIPLPSWLTRFIYNLHVTPQGLLVKKGKNDRLVWDGSFIPHWQASCINMMLSTKTEPTIIYGTAFMRHLERIWNLRISYPVTDILLFDDDVKGAFRHCKYHPDIAAAFSFIIEDLLFVPLGGTFGSITSPSNFEPIARARTHLAEFLSDRRDLLEKYADIIDKVEFSDEPDKHTVYVQAVADVFNQGVNHLEKTKYNMFVDDSLFAQIRKLIKHAMAASIEALYIVLGFPEIERRQNALSLDKYFETTCSYERIQLGINVNSRSMTVGLTSQKRIAMLDELSHWHKKRRSFTLLQGVILCGSIEFWANTSPWVRFLYWHLRSSVNQCLNTCSKITKDKKQVKMLISDLANTKGLDNFSSKERFVISKIAKDTYKCQHKVFINKSMKSELKLIINILSNPKKYKLETPISHIVKREPDFTTYGDACLEAGGGFCENFFWWHVEWPDKIKALTLKNLTVSRKCTFSKKLISINLLEFLVEIINYAAVTILFQSNLTPCKNNYPILLNWTDNLTSKSWIKKAATKTVKGKALQRILCSLMINNPLGIIADYIPGELNVLADAISRVYTNSPSIPCLNKLHQEFPQLNSWKRFHPSQELLSALYSGLLLEQDLGLNLPKNLGHFDQDKNIL